MACSAWSGRSLAKCGCAGSCHFQHAVPSHVQSGRCCVVSLSTWKGKPVSKCGGAGSCHFQKGVPYQFQEAGVLGRATFNIEGQVISNVPGCWVV